MKLVAADSLQKHLKTQNILTKQSVAETTTLTDAFYLLKDPSRTLAELPGSPKGTTRDHRCFPKDCPRDAQRLPNASTNYQYTVTAYNIC